MSIKVNGIESEEELKKAQAAAQAQGTNITNYQEWNDILGQFAEYGIESTGTYSGDVAKMKEIEKAVTEYVQEMGSQEQIQKQNTPQNKEEQKVQEVTETDKQQNIKANIAGATTADIVADYMKFYHLLI